MYLRVMDLFLENNSVVYALPAHTSAKLQPRDVVLFAVFNKYINEAIISTVPVN